MTSMHDVLALLGLVDIETRRLRQLIDAESNLFSDLSTVGEQCCDVSLADCKHFAMLVEPRAIGRRLEIKLSDVESSLHCVLETNHRLVVVRNNYHVATVQIASQMRKDSGAVLSGAEGLFLIEMSHLHFARDDEIRMMRTGMSNESMRQKGSLGYDDLNEFKLMMSRRMMSDKFSPSDPTYAAFMSCKSNMT